MPTMVAVVRGRLAGERDLLPTASAVPNICRAVNSLTMRTRGAPGPSRSSKPRPRRISLRASGIDGVAATAVTMRGGVSAAPACSAGAIEKPSALDTPKGSPPVTTNIRSTDRRACAEQTIQRPPRARLAPLRPVEIEDRDPDPIEIDAGVVPRFRDRVFHEHRRDDEEPGRDRDLPPAGRAGAGGAAARGSIRRRARRAGRSCASAGSPARGRRRPAPGVTTRRRPTPSRPAPDETTASSVR